MLKENPRAIYLFDAATSYRYKPRFHGYRPKHLLRNNLAIWLSHLHPGLARIFTMFLCKWLSYFLTVDKATWLKNRPDTNFLHVTNSLGLSAKGKSVPIRES